MENSEIMVLYRNRHQGITLRYGGSDRFAVARGTIAHVIDVEDDDDGFLSGLGLKRHKLADGFGILLWPMNE